MPALKRGGVDLPLAADRAGPAPLTVQIVGQLRTAMTDGHLAAGDVAAGLVGAVIKDPVQDRVVWLEYLETVVKERDGWKDLYRSCKEVL